MYLLSMSAIIVMMALVYTDLSSRISQAQVVDNPIKVSSFRGAKFAFCLNFSNNDELLDGY